MIPTSFQGEAHRIPFPHAFSQIAKVTVRGGPGISGYALTSVRADGSETTVKNEEDIATPLDLDPEAFQQFRPFAHWESQGRAWLRDVTPLFSGMPGSRIITASMRDLNGTTGHHSHFILRPPAEILDLFTGGKSRILALITAGIRWRFRDGLVIVEIDAAHARGLRVSLHGLEGKLLKLTEWKPNEISKGRLDWSPRNQAYAAGICLLRVVSGSQVFSARVILRRNRWNRP